MTLLLSALQTKSELQYCKQDDVCYNIVIEVVPMYKPK